MCKDEHCCETKLDEIKKKKILKSTKSNCQIDIFDLCDCHGYTYAKLFFHRNIKITNNPTYLPHWRLEFQLKRMT